MEGNICFTELVSVLEIFGQGGREDGREVTRLLYIISKNKNGYRDLDLSDCMSPRLCKSSHTMTWRSLLRAVDTSQGYIRGSSAELVNISTGLLSQSAHARLAPGNRKTSINITFPDSATENTLSLRSAVLD
ncbi:hypothetical protein RRG08_032698 [Elysia crispata]|uniref:Uncharacterized protein n=1 Tax=Elysia crispata TaxID=231223 RepID=A0AAE1D5G8_9GAST|nr:hypothetical protein RRG08_032698 [Elysia crispata]